MLQITIDGRTVVGTAEDLAAILYAEEMRQSPTYMSASRGLMLISKMDTRHIRNAILKKIRQWTNTLAEFENNEDFVAFIKDNSMEDDEELANLIAALETR